MIFLLGDGKLHHNFSKNTLGNSMRTWPYRLKDGTNRPDIYNNISVDTIKHSMIEVQAFQRQLEMRGDHVTFTNVRVYNNTAGNINLGRNLPSNGPGLWYGGLIDTYSTNGGSIDVQNNLLYNTT